MGTELQIRMRWESSRRYYAARVYRDLLGDLVLTRAWGGRFNALGRLSTHPVTDMDAAVVEIAQIDAQRRTRHYFQVPVL